MIKIIVGYGGRLEQTVVSRSIPIIGLTLGTIATTQMLPKERTNDQVAMAVAWSFSSSGVWQAGSSVLRTKPEPSAAIIWYMTHSAMELFSPSRENKPTPIVLIANLNKCKGLYFPNLASRSTAIIAKGMAMAMAGNNCTPPRAGDDSRTAWK
jgi:hypothetical protein